MLSIKDVEWEGGCDKIPNFNICWEMKGILCNEHKQQGMIDVVHQKKCEKCKATATYGLNGNIPFHCARHSDKKRRTISSKSSFLKM